MEKLNADVERLSGGVLEGDEEGDEEGERVELKDGKNDSSFAS